MVFLYIQIYVVADEEWQHLGLGLHVLDGRGHLDVGLPRFELVFSTPDDVVILVVDTGRQLTARVPADH